MSKQIVFRRIGLFLIISILIIAVSLSLGFLVDKKNPTYESIPYVVEEPKVYVTNYGDCYHSSDCSYLHSSRVAKGKDKAKEQGYRACSRCYGVASGTIEVTYYKQVEKDMTNDIISKSIIGGVIVGAIICIFIPIKEKTEKEQEEL